MNKGSCRDRFTGYQITEIQITDSEKTVITGLWTSEFQVAYLKTLIMASDIIDIES